MPDRTLVVLLVEDNPHMLEMLAYGLQRSQAQYLPPGRDQVEVLTAANGQEAWIMLVARRVDVLVTDLYMPVLDGKALIGKARAELPWEALKILAISASSHSAQADALGAGADLFLRKPVRMQDLLEAVKELLR